MSDANHTRILNLIEAAQITLEKLDFDLQNRTSLDLCSADIALDEQQRSQLGKRVLPQPLQSSICWDMILELYVNQLNASETRAKQVKLASGVPDATAHRYLSALIDGRWVTKEANHRDRRVANLSLTDKSIRLIEDWGAKRVEQMHARFLLPRDH